MLCYFFVIHCATQPQQILLGLEVGYSLFNTAKTQTRRNLEKLVSQTDATENRTRELLIQRPQCKSSNHRFVEILVKCNPTLSRKIYRFQNEIGSFSK